MPIPVPPSAEDLLHHPVVSREAWLIARRLHLRNEKALTRMRDMVSAERRRLPWVKIEKAYIFDTSAGKQSLADLFEGRSQLIVQHFMFGPEWEAGCPGCSFDADHAEGALAHLEHHDVSYVRVSRAPLEKLLAYKRRMGWTAKWVSAHDSDFNYDFHVSFSPETLEKGSAEYNYEKLEGGKIDTEELHGLSVFYKNGDGDVFHTYSSYARGNEETASTLVYFDLTPKGRNEKEIMDWLKRHDEYKQKEKRTMKKATTHQPPEYHSVIPYITVEDAAGLIDFLGTVFSAKLGECIKRPDGKIMHAEVSIGDSTVMLADACEEMGPMPASLYVYVQDTDAAYKRALDAGATTIMPPADMFWGDRFCCVQDKWGNQWSPSTHTLDMTPEEIAQGARAFMEQQV